MGGHPEQSGGGRGVRGDDNYEETYAKETGETRQLPEEDRSSSRPTTKFRVEFKVTRENIRWHRHRRRGVHDVHTHVMGYHELVHGTARFAQVYSAVNAET
ncbi:hypothetical protein V1477_009611 [Vespula maculifrons]